MGMIDFETFISRLNYLTKNKFKLGYFKCVTKVSYEEYINIELNKTNSPIVIISFSPLDLRYSVNPVIGWKALFTFFSKRLSLFLGANSSYIS